MKKYISIDIGGTMIKYGIINEHHKIEEFHECDTQADMGGPYLINKIKQLILDEQKKQLLEGICISTAGIVDPIKGEIIYANENIPHYTGTKVKEFLERECSIPCEVENDVNCAGLSEQYLGAAKGSRVTLCITVGTGIGGCILLDGSVFRGFSNSAGEIGYMKIDQEEFQTIASGKAMVDKVNQTKGFSDKGMLNGKEIFALAKAGDPVCHEAIVNVCEYLGKGIANICYIINPEVVVLGGGIMKQEVYVRPFIQASLDYHLVKPIREHTKLVFAKNDNRAGMIGAYFNFRKKHEEIVE